MKVIITKTIGQSELVFEFEEDKTDDALSRAAIFATIPDKCGICGSANVMLDSNKGRSEKGVFTFQKVKCLESNCRAASTLGKNTDGVGFYWKKFEIYSPQGSGTPPTASEKPADDMPF